jgi:GDP-mannose transporter
MIYTGSKSLERLTVAMFTVFKNLTIILIAISEKYLFKTQITPLMWISFTLIVISSLIGGFNDLAFDAIGYGWMALNSLSTAYYLLKMKSTINRIGFQDFDSVYFNNFFAFFIMLFASIVTENWKGFYTD